MKDEKNLISKKEAFDFLKEFKKFAFRGNIIDLSVGVIIGGAFNKIISSLVDNVIMPLVSIILPTESSYKNWVLHVSGKDICFGLFIGDIISFLIISFMMFIFIKKLLFLLVEEKKEELSLEQKTLLEIRDILQLSSKKSSKK
jgi:large conductance mechanosensitive channel